MGNSQAKKIIHKLVKLLVCFSVIPFYGLFVSPLTIGYSIFIKSLRFTKISVSVTVVNLFVCWLILTANDPFTDDLFIPEYMNISEPILLKDSSNMNVINWSLLRDNIQENRKLDLVAVPGNPGIYEFALWYLVPTDGYLYVKAYEITKGTPLSTPRLKQRSKLVVEKSDKVVLYHNDFTIYEGDWGYPYAARIELWFSSDVNSADIMVADGNYIIEGWMR